jgi:hypothetical protein
MINLTAPKRDITLYEVIKLSNKDRDIADTIFDWAVYFDCPIDKDIKDCDDWYDRAMLLIALNVKVESTNEDYIICKFTDFINENRKAIDDFFNKVNKEEWQPRNMEYIEEDSEEFYDFYLTAFESFISGGYGINDYEVFCKCLLKGVEQ